jgi:intraflagellar transport protein 140
MSEQVLLTEGYGRVLWVHQVAAHKLAVEIGGTSRLVEIPRKVKGLAVTSNCFLAWDGQNAEIFKVSSSDITSIATLNCSQGLFALCEDYAFTAQHNCVTYYNIANGESHSMLLPYTDGDVISICTSKIRFTVVTSELIMKTFELCTREWKLISTISLHDVFSDASQALLSKANADSSLVAFVGLNESSTIRVVHIENESKTAYECGSSVQNFVWDLEDPRFLMASVKANEIGKENQNYIMSFFCTHDQMIFKEMQSGPMNSDNLVAVHIPYVIFSKKVDFASERNHFFVSMILREYEGVDLNEAQILRTVTDFCYHLTVGDIDHVIKLVKLIKNDAVWINLTQLCIKMRRMKLARLCLGKLRNAKALRTITHDFRSQNQNQLAGHYAIHMGMYDEAKEVWNETKNYSDMTRFYEASGQWEEAINMSATKDRGSLPLTYYQFAQHLRDQGDMVGAIAAFEKSNASKSEIPRMMLNSEKELLAYIESSSDKDTIKWWAQNAESHGDLESAVQNYERIGDILSLVRIYCLAGQTRKATELADSHQENLAAQYFVARHYEGLHKWPEAISYYSKSKCFGNAIKLAKEQKIEHELMQLALQSSSVHVLEVAKYFEKQNLFDRAIVLYKKAGNIKKALDLCFQTNNVKVLESIGTSLLTSNNLGSRKGRGITATSLRLFGKAWIKRRCFVDYASSEEI